MPRVAGDIPGPAPFFDPYVRDAGPGAPAGHARPAHRHRGRRARRRLGGGTAWVRCCRGRSCATRSSAGWRTWRGRRRATRCPALAQALDWCARHVPAEREPAVLLWGDVRLGNLVFDSERRVTAVLDWDLASLGPREMDLGWHFGLEFMMDALFGGRLPGFPGPAEVLERYRAPQRVRGEGPAVARGVRAGARAGHQRPPPAHHRRTSGGGRTRWATSCWRAWRRRRPKAGEARRCRPWVRAGSSSEKPMTPALATS